MYLGGGHYKGPVLDAKLSELIAAFSRRTGDGIIQYDDHLHVDSWVPGPLLPPDQLKLLKSMSRRGLAFIGDSPTGRMYVRVLTHLEEIEQEWLAEGIQNSPTMLSAQQRAELFKLNLTSLQTNSVHTTYNPMVPGDAGGYRVFLEDTGSGYNLNGEWINTVSGWNVTYVYVGLPFLHQLWQPRDASAQECCNPTFSLASALESLMRQMQHMALQTNMTILLGTANTMSTLEGETVLDLINNPDKVDVQIREACKACFTGAHKSECRKYSYTPAGMWKLNHLSVELAKRFDRLHVVRMDEITGWVQNMTGTSLYWGAGHYKGPVIDLKLSAMLCAVPLHGRVLKSCALDSRTNT